MSSEVIWAVFTTRGGVPDAVVWVVECDAATIMGNGPPPRTEVPPVLFAPSYRRLETPSYVFPGGDNVTAGATEAPVIEELAVSNSFTVSVGE